MMPGFASVILYLRNRHIANYNSNTGVDSLNRLPQIWYTQCSLSPMIIVDYVGTHEG